LALTGIEAHHRIGVMKAPQNSGEKREGEKATEDIGNPGTASSEGFVESGITALVHKPKAQIVPRTRFLLFAAIFYILLIAYLFIILFFPQSHVARFSAVFQSFWAQFLFLVLCLAGITLSLYGLFCFAFEEYLKSRWYRPKFGRVSLKESYITKEQLKVVLDEQELKIGDILLNSGRITKEQLETALTQQQSGSGRLGEVLKQMGYAEEEDIYWALGRMQRKIGEIMMDKGFLTKEDVDWLLDQQKSGPRSL
jgi:hypothetical protein